MDRPIQVGDLVQVVRWPCCGVALGYTYRVAEFRTWGERQCSKCKALIKATIHAKGGADPFDGLCPAIPLEWLKRIPPLSELEGEKTEEKLREPA